jgi:hypothetical protein
MELVPLTSCGRVGDGRVERIEVRWIGGGTDIINNPPDALVLLVAKGGICQPLLPRAGRAP